jgi:hypothetical protein
MRCKGMSSKVREGKRGQELLENDAEEEMWAAYAFETRAVTAT